MALVLDSLIVTFIALGLIVLVISAFVGWAIHKAAELGGPGFLSTELDDRREPEGDFSARAAESATEVGLEGHPRRTAPTYTFRGSSANQRETALEGRGAPGSTALARSPCQFCRRVRDALRNAWNGS